MAKRLLADFGTLGQLLHASEHSLAQSGGNTSIVRMLPAARALVLEALRENVQRVRFDPNDERVLTFLAGLFQGKVEEHLHVIFLDSHLRFIREECVASGGWSEIQVRIDPIVLRARALGAAHIVLAHNHPSGVCEPSEDDLDFTRNVIAAARQFGITVFDHLIVAGPSAFSMRKAGLL